MKYDHKGSFFTFRACRAVSRSWNHIAAQASVCYANFLGRGGYNFLKDAYNKESFRILLSRLGYQIQVFSESWWRTDEDLPQLSKNMAHLGFDSLANFEHYENLRYKPELPKTSLSTLNCIINAIGGTWNFIFGSACEQSYAEKFISLTNLQSLYLGLDFYNNTPSLLWRLYNLQKLRFCPRGDDDLAGIENLTNLKQLTLSNNSDCDLIRLWGLTNLEQLRLSDNESFSDGDFSGISQLTKLQHLSLAFSKHLSPVALSNLRYLSRLRSLNLTCWWDRLNTNYQNELGRLTALQSLNLSNCGSLSDEVWRDVATLTGLRILKLNRVEGKSLVWSVVEMLTKLKCLKYESIDSCSINVRVNIGRFTSLKRLELGDYALANLGMDIPLNIEKLTKLQWLSLDANGYDIHFNVSNFSDLWRLTNLRHLSIVCKPGSNIELLGISKLCRLQQLKFNCAARLTNIGLSAILSLSNLTWLSLRDYSEDLDSLRWLTKLYDLRINGYK